MPITTEQIALDGPLGTLRGLLHRPDATGDAPVVVLLHGFTGHHIEDRRLFVQMARYLAGAGFAALHVDFYGSGDSDGAFEDFTLASQVDDATAVLDWLATQPGLDAVRLGVVGLSMGGTVTALLAGREPRVKAAVFWNAASNPGRMADRLEAENGPDLDLGGIAVSRAFVASLRALDPLGALARYAGPGLVVHGTGDEVVPGAESEALAAALGSRGALRRIEGADHTFNRLDWRAELFPLTADWLAGHLQQPD